MFSYSLFVISVALISIIHGQMTVDDLARCIQSEGSRANEAELTALGFACQRNPNHASNRSPTKFIVQLASNILQGSISDPTEGANRWFSPTLMPKETQSSLCRAPTGNGTVDCDGGTEVSCGITSRYRPGWATPDKKITMARVRDCEYKFFKI